MIILEENFKWHLEAFASELFICSPDKNAKNTTSDIFIICSSSRCSKSVWVSFFCWTQNKVFWSMLVKRRNKLIPVWNNLRVSQTEFLFLGELSIYVLNLNRCEQLFRSKWQVVNDLFWIDLNWNLTKSLIIFAASWCRCWTRMTALLKSRWFSEALPWFTNKLTRTTDNSTNAIGEEKKEVCLPFAKWLL